jgi:hypothetical protein
LFLTLLSINNEFFKHSQFPHRGPPQGNYLIFERQKISSDLTEKDLILNPLVLRRVLSPWPSSQGIYCLVGLLKVPSDRVR